MRELKVIGLDVDGKAIICEGRDPADKFTLPVDDRLRAAVRGDRSLGQTLRDIEVKSVLRPRDIQARIRAGASVEQVAESSGMDITKVERFAHPVLLERQRAAELATAAHPILADGPAVMTLLESISSALVTRGPRAPRRRPGTPGATRTAGGPCRWPGRPACPTTSRTSASPPARTAAPSAPSTTRPAN